MGNRTSSDTDTDENCDDFPWFHILQWVGESLPSGTIFAYDIARAREAAISLCTNESRLRESISNEDISNFTLPTFLEEPDSDCDSPLESGNPTLVEFAADLLEKLPNLAHVRYDLVPSILSEDIFWRKFFSLLRHRILATIAS